MSLLAKIAASKPRPLDGLSAPRDDLPETLRVATLPEVDYGGADLNRALRLPGASLSLWPIQSQALAALRHAGGLFAPIAVGRGKTLVALLAGSVLGVKLSLVFTKARIVSQMRRDFERLRRTFRLVPTRILSYATLSRPTGANLLGELADRYGPEDLLLVFDEAHALASTSSARTMRVIRFLRENPGVRVAAMSGTFLSRSIEESAHIAEMALRSRSPFPGGGVFRNRSRAHLDAWKETLDPDGRPASEHWERMTPLASRFGADLSLSGRARRKSLREAFSKRLRSAPGVVCSSEEDLGVSLTIVSVSIPFPARLQDCIDCLISQGTDPSGEVIADDVAQWRKARELSAGFFYRWDWPDGPDLEWLEARREWARCVRAELTYAADRDYDSPLLVSQRIEREILAGPARRSIHRAWEAWRQEKQKPEPPTVPVWLDRFLVGDALALAKTLEHKGEPPLIWYGSKAIEEAFIAAGVRVYAAGDEPPDINAGVPPHVAAASLCHATGRNLQQWRTAIVVEPPSSAKAWEQLLGRLHRRGQRADEVVFYVYQHTDAYRNALKNAEEKAAFVAESTGERQRLLYADRSEEARR